MKIRICVLAQEEFGPSNNMFFRLIIATRDEVLNFKVREIQPSPMANTQPRCKTCVGSAGKHPTSPEIKPNLTKSRGKPAESLLLKEDIYRNGTSTLYS